MTNDTTVCLKAQPINPDSPAACGFPDPLVRPRFFAGQLLTSEDLAALERWGTDRLRLRRQLTGWGIVCGLDVTADPADAKKIRLSPGYAIDCEGRDISVAREIGACLGALCTQAPDSCQNGQPTLPNQEGQFRIGGFALPLTDVRALDLILRYRTQGTTPKPVLARCGSGHRCEYSREEETFELCYQEIDLSTQPGTADTVSSTTDCSALSGKLPPELTPPSPAVVDRDGNTLPGLSPEAAKKLKTWVLQQLGSGSYPAGEFGFLVPWVNSLTPQQLALVWKLTEVLFWTTLACRRIRPACAPCNCAADDVPLARVYLRGSGGDCAVLFVDSSPPYRRALGPDAALDTGRIDVRPYVESDWDAARVALTQAGLKLNKETFTMPATLPALQRLLDADQAISTGVDYGSEVIALVTPHDDQFAGRVVAFRAGNATDVRPDMAVTIAKVTALPYDTGNTPMSAPTIVTQPFDPGSFTPSVLPYSGQVRFGVTLSVKPTVPSAPRSFDLYLYHPLQQPSQPQKVSGTLVDKCGILTPNISIPTLPSSLGSVEVTVLVVEKFNNVEARTMAATGMLSLPVQSSPVGLNLSATPPPPTTVIPGEDVNIYVRASNNGKSRLRGVVQAQPLDKDGNLTGTKTSLGTFDLAEKSQPLDMLPYPVTVTANSPPRRGYRFWVDNGTESFGRHFTGGDQAKIDVQFTVRLLYFVVTKLAAPDTSQNTHQLIVHNDQVPDSQMTIFKLSIKPGNDNSQDLVPAAKPLVQGKGQSDPLFFKASTSPTKATVIVDFQYTGPGGAPIRFPNKTCQMDVP